MYGFSSNALRFFVLQTHRVLLGCRFPWCSGSGRGRISCLFACFVPLGLYTTIGLFRTLIPLANPGKQGNIGRARRFFRCDRAEGHFPNWRKRSCCSPLSVERDDQEKLHMGSLAPILVGSLRLPWASLLWGFTSGINFGDAG